MSKAANMAAWAESMQHTDPNADVSEGAYDAFYANAQFEDCEGYEGGCGSPSCLSCSPPEPCCYTFSRTRGAQHDYDCEEY